MDRLLFVPEIVAFGGGERIYLSLSKFLHEQGMPHRIVSYYQDIPLQDFADWPLKVDLISPGRNPLRKAWALKRYFARSSENPKPLLVGLQSAMHAATFGLKNYNVMILDTPSLLTSGPQELTPLSREAARARAGVSDHLTRRGLHNASRVIITTHVMADEVENLYGLRPQVSYQGVSADSSRYSYRPLMPDTPLRFLSVCRLEDNKRIDWMLRALAALEAGDPPLHVRKDWRLDIVGDGKRAGELRGLAQTLGLADRIIFHGFVSEERLEEMYGKADIFLMPAVQGYGLPALEALTRKISVVMHAQSGASEILGGSPWVEIIGGGEETLTAGIEAMVSRLLADSLSAETLPSFPTESQWAEEVCRLCGWI